jgi:hypothetical protein
MSLQGLSDLGEIELTLLGVVVGAIIGFVASYLLWFLQERAHKKSVISAFQIEIERLEPVLQRSFIIVQKIKTPKYDSYGNDEYFKENFEIYQELRLLKLYTDSGNWFVLKKDAYSLNPIISSELDVFYYNLIEAEFFREKYLGENYRDKRDIYLEPLAKKMENAINNLPKIKTLLRE